MNGRGEDLEIKFQSRRLAINSKFQWKTYTIMNAKWHADDTDSLCESTDLGGFFVMFYFENRLSSIFVELHVPYFVSTMT